MGDTWDTIAKGAAPSAAQDMLYSSNGTAIAFGQGSSLHEAVSVPTLLNSWVNYGGANTNAGYYKSPLGRVYLKGTVKSGTIGSTIFTLPAGYTPAATRNFVVISNGAVGQCDILSTGAVNPVVGSNVWFSLDGISFDL